MDSIHSWIDKDEVSRLAESLSASPERMKEWKKLETDGFAMPEKQGQTKTKTSTPQPTPSAPATTAEAPVSTPLAAPTPPTTPVDETEKATEVNIAPQVLDQHRSALAGASEIAKSSGLIQAQKTPPVAAVAVAKTEVVEVVEEAKIDSPEPKQEVAQADVGTFESVKSMLSEQIGTDGVCAIDIDGDVLFDDLGNAGISHFVANVMKTSSLMQVAEGEVDGMRIKASGSDLLEFVSVRSTRGVVLVAARVQQVLTQEKRLEVGQKLIEVLNS